MRAGDARDDPRDARGRRAHGLRGRRPGPPDQDVLPGARPGPACSAAREHRRARVACGRGPADDPHVHRAAVRRFGGRARRRLRAPRRPRPRRGVGSGRPAGRVGRRVGARGPLRAGPDRRLPRGDRRRDRPARGGDRARRDRPRPGDDVPRGRRRRGGAGAARRRHVGAPGRAPGGRAAGGGRARRRASPTAAGRRGSPGSRRACGTCAVTSSTTAASTGASSTPPATGATADPPPRPHRRARVRSSTAGAAPGGAKPGRRGCPATPRAARPPATPTAPAPTARASRPTGRAPTAAPPAARGAARARRAGDRASNPAAGSQLTLGIGREPGRGEPPQQPGQRLARLHVVDGRPVTAPLPGVEPPVPDRDRERVDRQHDRHPAAARRRRHAAGVGAQRRRVGPEPPGRVRPEHPHRPELGLQLRRQREGRTPHQRGVPLP